MANNTRIVANVAFLPLPSCSCLPWISASRDNRSAFPCCVGIKLRKVEVEEKRREETRPLHDVASILARRVAIEVSDSNSGSDSEGWDDETSA